MKYIVVKWNHERKSDPEFYYMEIDEGNYEVRRAEIYKDKSIKRFSRNESPQGLSPEPVPCLNELNEESEFEAVELTQQQFEAVWRKNSE